jgi:hypothetical protein
MNRVSIPGPPLVAVQRSDLAVDPVPIDLAGKLHQFVLEVDDLVEPRAEQIARSRRLMLLRPHRALRCGDRIMLRHPKESRKRNCKVQQAQTPKPCNLKPVGTPKSTRPQSLSDCSQTTLYRIECEALGRLVDEAAQAAMLRIIMADHV